MAIIQSIPAVSPLNPMTAWNPLIFVIGLSMLREFAEDYFRNKADKVANGMPTKVFRDAKFV
jgi:hypothetical protein